MDYTRVIKFKKAFGERLKALRLSKKLTQEQLAWNSELDHTTVWRIEKGITDPKLSTIYLLAEVLGVEVSELVLIERVGS